MGSRINGGLTALAGFIISIVGFGMYKSPHLDWNVLVQSLWESLQILADRINHLINDPLALIGAIVLIIGIAIIFKGLKSLILG
ncbi:MAG: hypothetical protein QXD69_02695 [Candidatus Bathyarchaeia archaeon]